MPQLKIAIVGAGPAGCTLALILHQAGIPSIIFEGEDSVNSRHQGGTLDLHETTGLAALKKAGVYDKFTKLARYDGEAIKISNKHFRLFIHTNGTKEGSSRGRPEIDRAQLRQLLFDALPRNSVRWGHHLSHVEDNAGNFTLHFKNSRTESGFDLIVGADGAWSKVRTVLTPVKPFYSGVNMTRYQISDAANRHPALSHIVNRGSIFAFDRGGGISSQQMSDGSMTVSAIRIVPEDFISHHPEHNSDIHRSKSSTLEDFKDWSPQLTSFVSAADEDETPWNANIYMLPSGLRWPHRRGVTVIGDAAHVMVPFAGEGVNASMADSASLAEAIISSANDGDRLDAAVRTFEEAMFTRNAKVSAHSFEMMQCAFFGSGGMDEGIDGYINTALEDEMPWGLKTVAGLAVRAYFTWFRWRYPGHGRIDGVQDEKPIKS